VKEEKSKEMLSLIELPPLLSKNNPFIAAMLLIKTAKVGA
jgi:hypothetical protein